MRIFRASHFLALFVALLCAVPAFASTWYVRPDGGTRFSNAQNTPKGQCDGLGDAAYPGVGVNQHCAFNDFRLLYQDGSYAYFGSPAPAWGWVIQGGDTVILRGSVGTGVSYRVGWSNPTSCIDSTVPSDQVQARGACGDYAAGAPPPPSGTATQHTRILGENYGSCSAQSARSQLHGGYGVGAVLDLSRTSYVDVQCVDITDFSNCSTAGGATNKCSQSNDFAGSGILLSNTSTNLTLNNVRTHGLGSFGIYGPTGTGAAFTNVDMVGNGAGGWNADLSDGTTGVGTLLVQNFSILWNGCAEEYPISDALPYQDCTDDASGGYGDGFGTATVTSTAPWTPHFDQGVVAYNTQDGLDALHIIGGGSYMTATHVLAYGNMGNQLKVGGAGGVATNNLLIGNCNALRYAIPGTPSNFNSKLSDFCRAGDGAVVMTTGVNESVQFAFNTIYSANAVGFELECDGTNGQCDGTSKIDFRNNVFLGFVDNAANGNPLGQGYNSTPIYVGDSFQGLTNPFTNAGSLYSNNATFNPRAGWPCPNTAGGESNAICVDPQLTDETWHLYGYPNATPLSTSPLVGAGAGISGIVTDEAMNTRPSAPSIGALESMLSSGSASAAATTTSSSASSTAASTSTAAASTSSTSASSSSTPTTSTGTTSSTSGTSTVTSTGSSTTTTSTPTSTSTTVSAPAMMYCVVVAGASNTPCLSGTTWVLH